MPGKKNNTSPVRSPAPPRPSAQRAIQPVGQLLSCSIVRHVFPGPKHISGVAADVVLRTPGIRLLYSWLGIRKAGRQSILEMFEQNINVSRFTCTVGEKQQTWG